jgi:hypothetical protein
VKVKYQIELELQLGEKLSKGIEEGCEVALAICNKFTNDRLEKFLLADDEKGTFTIKEIEFII